MRLDYLILKNLSISGVVAWPGNMGNLHFLNQLNLDFKAL